MTITFVKKILLDGSACRKCAEVEQRLQDAGYMPYIDRIVVADERDAASEGLQLARKYQVERAPFFIVTDDAGEDKIYTVYFKLVKEILAAGSGTANNA